MSSKAPESFVWFTHQPASTRWLKSELARPELRFAFSRPGLATFKVIGDADAGAITSSFARARGYSLGRATTIEDVLALVPAAMQQATQQQAMQQQAMQQQAMQQQAMQQIPNAILLHVFERDPDRPADERDIAIAGTRAAALDAQLRAAGRFDPRIEARDGDIVLDVIVAAAEEPDDGIFVGWHRHDSTHGPFPGGVPHVAIPADAPSRAWAKIEEAIRWSGLVPEAGETAIELGSSPGGASFALLERGLHVHGVDPGKMDPRVLANPRFTHHAMPAAEVPRAALPRTYEWLASDVNLAPMVALRYVERFVALAHGGLRGAFITLKINDDGIFEALPRLQSRIAKLGAKRVRYTQLPSHRSEIVALLDWLA